MITKMTMFLFVTLAFVFAERVTFTRHELGKLSVHGQGVMTIGDIDGDGKGDIVNALDPYAVSWRKASDLKTIYAIEKTPVGIGCEIHLADMDSDGDNDLVAPSKDMTKAPLWWENPLPNKKPEQQQGWVRHGDLAGKTAETHDMDVGDLDGDGIMEIVWRHKSGKTTVLFRNEANQWKSATLQLDGSEGTALADFDNDGDLDICDGTGWYETPKQFKTGAQWIKHSIGDFSSSLRRVLVVDIDKDNDLDVFLSVAEFHRAPFLWFENTGNPKGTWTPHIIDKEAKDYNYHTLEAADFDNDGKLDILIGSTHGPNDKSITKKMTILFNDDGNFTQLTRVSWDTPYGMWQAQIGDVGGDGDIDIVNCDYGANIGRFELWENTSQTVSLFRTKNNSILPSYNIQTPKQKLLPNGRQYQKTFKATPTSPSLFISSVDKFLNLTY